MIAQNDAASERIFTFDHGLMVLQSSSRKRITKRDVLEMASIIEASIGS